MTLRKCKHLVSNFLNARKIVRGVRIKKTEKNVALTVIRKSQGKNTKLINIYHQDVYNLTSAPNDNRQQINFKKQLAQEILQKEHSNSEMYQNWSLSTLNHKTCTKVKLCVEKIILYDKCSPVKPKWFNHLSQPDSRL